MIIPIRLYKLKRILQSQWSLFLSLGVFILLLCVVYISYTRFTSQKEETGVIGNEVQALKKKFDTLKINEALTENKIKEYNLLLASLVPETEDFFSIIYALEHISSVSQFMITNYTIDVSKTNNERLTLTVEGKGDAEAFLSFLQEYQFSGGRLATSNKIQYGDVSSGSTRVALNFYNKRFTFDSAAQVPQLSQDDVAKLEAIKQKIKFQFSSSEYQLVNPVYPLKKDPFSEDLPSEKTDTASSAGMVRTQN